MAETRQLKSTSRAKKPSTSTNSRVARGQAKGAGSAGARKTNPSPESAQGSRAKATSQRRASTAKTAPRKGAVRQTSSSKSAPKRVRANAKSTQSPSLAERVLVASVGASLEARDGLMSLSADLYGRYGSVSATEQQLKRTAKTLERDFRRFERRGNSLRASFNRSGRDLQGLMEDQLRAPQRGLEHCINLGREVIDRELGGAERSGSGRRATLSEQLETVSYRVGNVMQAGVTNGERLVSSARRKIYG